MKFGGLTLLCLLACVGGGCGVTLDFDPPDPREPRDAGATGSDMSAPPEDLGTPIDGGPMRDAFVVDLPGPDFSRADLGPDLPTSRDAGMDLITVVDLGRPDLSVSGCGATGFDCLGGEYCMLSPGVCDDTTAIGVCTLIPAGCGGVVAPVCGCDGATYTNACFAAAAGVNVARDGTCSCSHTIDCCCVDTDCAATEECVVDVAGGSGRCETRLTSTGGCWRDSDCGVGGICVGVMVCPCGFSCFAPDTPGSCG